jgi:MoaA/NifB/PqqE/SkfB family radical SAM enzyme
MIPFQLHRGIPFIRRLFWQRDSARQEVQELRDRGAEHDALIAQPKTQIAELQELRDRGAEHDALIAQPKTQIAELQELRDRGAEHDALIAQPKTQIAELQELRDRGAEHDALIAQPKTQIAELEEKSRTSEAFDWVNPPDRVSWLQVETTTLCSLKCAGCGRTVSHALGQWTDQHMSAARFRKIVEHAPPSETIVVQGVGEPTLNPDFLEIVSIAGRSGKYRNIMFSTHGLARNVTYFRKLVDAGLTYFFVSVDSFDPKNAERLRAGTDVEKLRNRIRGFAEAHLPFGIAITVSRHNMTEISETLRILDGLAAAHRFQVHLHNFQSGGAEHSSWVMDHAETRRLKALVPEFSARFPNIDVHYGNTYDGTPDVKTGDTPDVKTGDTPDVKTGICDAPRSEPFVKVDGSWGVCCHSYNTEALGNTSLEKLPFQEAWRGPQAQHFLESYSKQSPRFCDGCPRNLGRLSPEVSHQH